MMLLALISIAIVALCITSAAALKGWQGWLELKRLEIAGASRAGPPAAGSRGELAGLKERVRKLEAIASGIE